MLFYHSCLSKAIGIELTGQGINNFLGSLSCGNGKFAYFRAVRALCNWLHRQNILSTNPISLVDSPSVAKAILPSVTEQQVELLLKTVTSLREKGIISLLFDSGLRLNEICINKPENIDWNTNTLKVVVKGNREAKATFTTNTAILMKDLWRLVVTALITYLL